jgi:hypothetical protein
MAEHSPVIKELQEGIRSNAEAIAQMQSEFLTQFRRSEVDTAERFNLLHEAIAAFVKKAALDSSSHGTMNSNRPPFQVRSVKLDFP